MILVVNSNLDTLPTFWFFKASKFSRPFVPVAWETIIIQFFNFFDRHQRKDRKPNPWKSPQ